ncbi:ABC transporter permease subunit [Ferrimonas aestuarii]|uniref:ABC transporter n=1 Tax=Ferrimonas aestuarii TaxID=2569539 RepID=A0A4U1BUT2_9GAMM|nr:ABC transporter permease subunit [Ferrimonas aestuarii]TKB56581.1 ABC transporter [Ferrimonas aestuarii]
MSAISPHGLWLTAQFELKRLFTTKRGLLWLAAFSIVWGVLLRYPILGASNLLREPAVQELVNYLNPAGEYSQLFAWGSPEMAAYWLFALLLFPMTSIGMAADQLASDLSRGTLRFLVLRCSRTNLLLGRFLGMMLAQLFMVLVSLLGALILAMSSGEALLLPLLGQCLLVMLNLFVVLLPFTATMALLSILARSGRQAVILATLFWIVAPLAVGLLSQLYAPLAQLKMLIPGGQILEQVSLLPAQALTLNWLPLLQTLIMLALARIALLRTSL